MIKKLLSKRLWRLAALVGMVFVILSGLFIFVHKSRRIPTAQAQEYIQAVLPIYEALHAKLRFYQGGFAETSKSFNTSKEAFYEITTSRDYFSAVEDTQKDIEEINQTLDLIAQAVEEKKQASAPAELKPLDEDLDAYYQHASAGLKELLIHEKLQMAMLTASGDELNQAVGKFDTLWQKASKEGLDSDESEEFAALLKKIGQLGDESVTRFTAITDIPVDEEKYYAFQKDYHADLARSFRQMYEELHRDPINGQASLVTSFIEFGIRNGQRQKAREADTKTWVEVTQIKTNFSQTAELEVKITAFIDDFLKRYDIAIQPSLEPSISPVLEPSLVVSVSPTIELGLSPSPSPSPIVIPTVEPTLLISPEPTVAEQ